MKLIYKSAFVLLAIFLLGFFSIKPVNAAGAFESALDCVTNCGGPCTHADPDLYYCLDPAAGNVSIGRDFNFGSTTFLGRSGFESISALVSSILPNVYIIAGVILLFLIIGSGFAIMSSTNDPQKKAQGGKALTAAIVGFLLLFTSYWIIQIIQRITGVPILNTSGIPGL